MSFDIQNFVIERPKKIYFSNNSTGTLYFTLKDIKNIKIPCASESRTAVDAMGTKVAEYYSSKSAELTGEAAFFDMNLFAKQMGTDKKVATSTSTILTPQFETITFAADTLTYTTLKTPSDNITDIYELKSGDLLGTKYTASTTADATHFSYNTSTHVITLPTGLTTGSKILIKYYSNEQNAVEIVNSATAFPEAGELILEVIGNEICNQSNRVVAYYIFPNAKLSPDVDISVATDGVHPFSFSAQQDYCSDDNKLFRIVIPQLD